jgi:predicted lipoprotein with Yx(FWY)xxD motif
MSRHTKVIVIVAIAALGVLVLSACSSPAATTQAPAEVVTQAPTEAATQAATEAATQASSGGTSGKYGSGSDYGQPATQAATEAAGAAVTVNTSTDPKLGPYLTGPTGMTLYTTTKDSKDTSTCTGNCANNWPPLLVPQGGTVSAGSGLTGTLSTITLADGSTMVTYNGIPLYSFAKDTKPGDVSGEGVGNVWHVAKP